MSQSAFQKFTAKKKNSVIKEEFRQQKKKYIKEKRAYFDNLKEEEYKARMAKKNGMATAAADGLKGKAAKEESRRDKNAYAMGENTGSQISLNRQVGGIDTHSMIK